MYPNPQGIFESENSTLMNRGVEKLADLLPWESDLNWTEFLPYYKQPQLYVHLPLTSRA
jgi:hypothetical protein